METEDLPNYKKIAAYVANLIADGDLKEGERIEGRSKLASLYGVSPETVRKALRLLADMKVVEVKEQSGVFVLSADNANRYLQTQTEKETLHNKIRNLQSLIEANRAIENKIFAICQNIIETQESPLSARVALPQYEVQIAENCSKSGMSLGMLSFWQNTGATVVAIRRNEHVIVSPGSKAEIFPGDWVIFVGDEVTRQAVIRFLNDD